MNIDYVKENNRLCETVFQAIIKLNNADKIKLKIDGILKKEKCFITLYTHYDIFIWELMDWIAINKGTEDAIDLFKNFFCDDLKTSPTAGNIIAIIACKLSGILDLYSIYRNDLHTDNFLDRLLFDSEHSYELLIVGETGTGKQLFAQALHLMGNRNKKPFQEINCAAIPESMLEAELFGYEKGSFTGADKQKKGLLEEAKDGIIFLDELGKMPVRLQAKLLKVIQDNEFRRLGGHDMLPINARFIAAAQPDDLEENILPDLKYRFNYPDYIEVPTLNERIKFWSSPVIESALEQAKRAMGVEEAISYNDELINLLVEHDYKGNYRELRSILNKGIREALMHNRNEILPKDVIDVLNIDKRTSAKNTEHELSSIKLKDIFEHAENIKKTIIEKKISEILKSGKTIKAALSEEGLYQEKDYQNFRKKIVTITGKNLKDL